MGRFTAKQNQLADLHNHTPRVLYRKKGIRASLLIHSEGSACLDIEDLRIITFQKKYGRIPAVDEFGKNFEETKQKFLADAIPTLREFPYIRILSEIMDTLKKDFPNHIFTVTDTKLYIGMCDDTKSGNPADNYVYQSTRANLSIRQV